MLSSKSFDLPLNFLRKWTRSSARAQVNNHVYNDLGERWYTAYDDPIALLRAESKVKAPWIMQKMKYHGKINEPVLDVGCGAGFVSNPLALEGFQVTGLDASLESLAVAHCYDGTKSVDYIQGDAYVLPFPDESFGAVTALDFLEHVDDPERAIKEISRVLKPGGLFFYQTLNRNWLSHFVAIKLVEWLVLNTPKDMHVIDLFIKPKEMAKYCRAADMSTQKVVGLRPVFSSIPVSNYFSGVVPESLRFKIIKSTFLSYLGYAIKNEM